MANHEPAVLVVDDDPIEGELLVRALRKSGFQNHVQVVTNGEDAKQYLRGGGSFEGRGQFPAPSLVILDHRMPGEDGWDVLKWMRQKAMLKRLPVVVFSGSGTHADQARAADLDAVFQVKPGNQAEYQAAVQRMTDFWLRSISRRPA